MTPRVVFDTSAYIRAHGHDPRGVGSWAFFPSPTMCLSNVHWEDNKTFVEAKSAARRWARAHGVSILYVGT